MHPPAPIVAACASGLSRWRRTRRGGTHAAVTFAELTVQGFPVDLEAAAEAAEAHRLLSETDDDSEVFETARLLWGGADAAAWLETVATPEPITANLNPSWLTTLNRRLTGIDETALAQIEGALRAAVLSATRAIGARLAAKIRRIPAPVLAEHRPFDMQAARPYRTWDIVPAPIRAEAAVDVEEAIEAAAEDLATAIAEIVEQARAAADDTIDDVTELPPPPDPGGSDEDAAAIAVALFVAWMLARFARPSPDDLPGQAEANDRIGDPPDQMAQIILAVAGGASVVDGTDVARDELGQIVDRNNVPTGGGLAAKRGFDAIEAAARAGANLPGIDDIVRPVLEFEWVYGPVGERFRPYEPHKDLDGKRWRMDDPDADIVITDPDALDIAPTFRGFYPGDHVGCRCRPPRPDIVLVSVL